jgi:glutathione S-transferase
MKAAPKLRLVTIAPSHYCEKARWALDRVGARYREEPHLPILHFLATVRPGRKSRTVPILITPHGELTDSTDILRHLDGWVTEKERLYPEAHRAEVEELEELFDSELGPATRRWGYCWVLDHPAAFRAMFDNGGPRAERIAFRAAEPLITRAMRQAFKVSEKGKARSLERIQSVFAKVESRLAGGKKFLVGDRFTAADLTLACLAAPALGPEGYKAQTPPRHILPMEMQKQMDALRATPTGEHVLRLFKEQRTRVVPAEARAD